MATHACIVVSDYKFKAVRRYLRPGPGHLVHLLLDRSFELLVERVQLIKFFERRLGLMQLFVNPLVVVSVVHDVLLLVFLKAFVQLQGASE